MFLVELNCVETWFIKFFVIMYLFQIWFFIIVLNTIHANLDIDESLILKICNMKFCDATKTDCDLSYCYEQMLSESKFGDCPTISNSSDTKNSCFDDCYGQDYRCSSALKCFCNRSCIMAENLNRISTFILPPIPTNVNVVSIEHDARRRAKMSWFMRIPHNRYDEHIEYIIEARAHVGNTFSKHKLGQWFVINIENFHFESMHSHNSKLSCWVLLEIGRFYEFRILALNGNGTRGYSETAVFQLNEKPKHLPTPANFTVESTPKLMANNSVYTRLMWHEPNSDYPVEKYEVSCSRFINEGNGSLYMEKLRLPVTQNFMEFYDLLPDSNYYVQVNAQSSFGRKRIRSDKVSINFNTTIGST